MSTRNMPVALRPARSSSVRLRISLELLEIVDAVAELPAPVVPLLVGHIGPDRRAAADGGLAVRAQHLGRVAAVDERLLGGGGPPPGG